CREAIQDRVIREFREEQERAKQPGYVSRYDDFDIDDYPPSRGHRQGGRNHPTTNYTRPGSEPASRAEHAESHPPAPDRPGPHAPNRQRANEPATDNDGASSSSKIDGFGAGIF